MKTKLFVAAILLVMMVSACNRNHKESTMVADNELADLTGSGPLQKDARKAPSNEQQKIPLGALKALQADSSGRPALIQPTTTPDWDKKIIKTAHLQIEVKDFKNYNDIVHNVVKHFGGYVASEEQHSGAEKVETAIVIKMPVDQFDGMMSEISGGGNKILEKNITTQDVTGEMVDTRLRLEAKKAMRLKYLEFLKQSKNMEEVLQVQNEINGIQEEMESAAGRIEFLSHQSSYSTINLSFYQPVNGYKPVEGPPVSSPVSAILFSQVSPGWQIY